MADRIDNLVDQQRVDAEFARINKHIDALVKRIQALNALAGQFNLGGNGRGGNGGGTGGGGRGTSNQARTELEQLQAAIDRLNASNRASAQLIAQYNYQTNQQQRANRAAAQAASNHATSLNGMRARLMQLTQQYDNYDRAQRRSRNEGRQTLAQIQALQREITALERATGRFGRNVGNYPKLVGGLTGFLGAFGVATGAAAIGKEIFDTTVQLDSLNAAMRAVSKTEGEYATNQKFLTDLSDRLGLKVIDLTQAYKLFYAASTEAGLSAFTTRKIFSSVAEVSANLKLSQEDTNGVLLAFSQILGKGKVQAEELRGQIGERLPGAFSIAARSIGVTEQELNKMLQKGEVIASEFLPKFAAELEKTFGVDNQEEVQGLQASINRLSNSFTKMISDNEGGLSVFFGKIIDLARGALEAINNLTAGISYVSLKLTDKDAADKFLNTKAIQDYSKTLKGLSTDSLLTSRNNVDKNLEIQKNQLQGVQATVKSIRDAYGKYADDVHQSTLESSEDTIKRIQGNIDLLNKQREALLAELRARFPANATDPTTSTKKTATQAELNAAARLREREIKADADAAKFELQVEIEKQKAIIDNEQASFADRMGANEEYYRLKNELSKADADAEKKRIDVELGRNRASAKEKETIDKKLAYEQEKNLQEQGKNLIKILKDNADDRTKTILAEYEIEKQIIDRSQNEELEKTQAYYKEGKINKEQYEAELLRIKNKYAILTLQAELETQTKILQIMKQQGIPVEDQEAKLLEIKNKIRDLDLEYFNDTEKAKTKIAEEQARKQKKIEEDKKKLIADLQKESVEAVYSILTARYENEKNAVQDQIDQLDKKTQKEIEAVNRSTDSEQNKADKIAVINSRAAAQKEALERRQREIDQQKARFDRAKAIAEVIAQTAVNVVKFFSVPVLAVLAAAVGAAQLAQIVATPIPKYKHGAGVNGRPAHKGGIAQVNDGGKLEVLQTPSGQAYVAQGMNAYVDMPAGTKVYPSMGEYYDAMNSRAFRPIPIYESTSADVLRLTDVLTKQYAQQTQQLIAGMERNKAVMIVKNTHSGMKASLHHASGIINYQNYNVFN